jgi:hypothetical protein
VPSGGSTEKGISDVEGGREGGVYSDRNVQTPMVYIRFWKSLMEKVLQTLPGLKEYVDKDGVRYCKLLKA